MASKVKRSFMLSKEAEEMLHREAFETRVPKSVILENAIRAYLSTPKSEESDKVADAA